jgi:hypothetical protein
MKKEKEEINKMIMEASDAKWNALGQALADGIKYRIFCRRLTPLAEEFKELLRGKDDE